MFKYNVMLNLLVVSLSNPFQHPVEILKRVQVGDFSSFEIQISN